MTVDEALKLHLVEQTPMRRAIARRMSESKRDAPHFYISTTVEFDAALASLAQANAARAADSRITVTGLLVHAVAYALGAHPTLNAVWTADGLATVEQINIGVAIATDGGVIAPALLDCGRLPLAETSAALADLVTRTRSGKVRGPEMTDATFTVSNLGMFPVTQFTAIVTPPQVAILAAGALEAVPRLQNGALVEEQRLTLTLSADHRALDGADAARFLATLKTRLEKGETP